MSYTSFISAFCTMYVMISFACLELQPLREFSSELLGAVDVQENDSIPGYWRLSYCSLEVLLVGNLCALLVGTTNQNMNIYMNICTINGSVYILLIDSIYVLLNGNIYVFWLVLPLHTQRTFVKQPSNASELWVSSPSFHSTNISQ